MACLRFGFVATATPSTTLVAADSVERRLKTMMQTPVNKRQLAVRRLPQTIIYKLLVCQQKVKYCFIALVVLGFGNQ
jgi:hypothetical protein